MTDTPYPDHPRSSGSTGRHAASDDNSPQTPDRTDIERTQHMLGDRYELSWIIGRGGMSTVWLAWDKELERDVAIKILKPEYTDSAEFRTRFRNEAEAAQQLRSPNVVSTYDYGEVHDHGAKFSFIVMEYVRGESLADVLSRERTLPEFLALDVLLQAARGLDTIHSAGMVHRDIKPGNLLITSDGIVKVTDFGIAKAAEAVPLTRTGMVVGTAQYVSPEQAQGLNVAPASDVYSLGVVGYEMLAGQRPFVAESTVSVAIKHISEEPQPLPDTISSQARELVSICLRKAPNHRYSDGQELAAAAMLVSQGNRPPQPHRMPSVPEVEDHDYPTTEVTNARLGSVATGQGTRVPPQQGPGLPAGAGARPSHPNTGHRKAQRTAHTGQRPAQPSGVPETQKSRGNGLIVVLGLIAVAAVGLAGYMLLANNDKDDKPAPPAETTTVTTEATTEESTPTSTTQQHTTYAPAPETMTYQREQPEEFTTITLPSETFETEDEVQEETSEPTTPAETTRNEPEVTTQPPTEVNTSATAATSAASSTSRGQPTTVTTWEDLSDDIVADVVEYRQRW